ncbi:MAG: HEPN domain-containing protein [Chloroflexota bacterium]
MTPRDRARELLGIATGDEQDAHLLRANERLASASFHYQQAAEKLLKALLADRNVDYPRSHDMGMLAELVAAEGFEIPATTEDLIALTPFAATLRYEATQTEAELDLDQTNAMVKRLRAFVEEALR